MFAGRHSPNSTSTHNLRTRGRGSSRAKRERKEEVDLDNGLISLANGGFKLLECV